MTVYSSRRNIKRDRYCKRVIIIWRLRYRNTRVLFIHFSFPPPPSCISPSSLFPISLVLSSKINIAQRLSQVSIYSRNILIYLSHAYTFFVYVLEEVQCLCGSTVRFRFRHEPPPWRGTRYSRRRWTCRKPDLCSRINSPSSATCWLQAETGVLACSRDTREIQ